MQIHELNNFNGTLGAGSYVAIDDGVDTGKISTDRLLSQTEGEINSLGEELNGRIDNIIAGGAAPSKAEIIDARRGINGINYSSLGDAIRAQAANLDGDLKSFIYGTNRTFSGTPSAMNKFPVLLINGETYSYTNNTGATISLILYKADGTEVIIDGNMADGLTVTFTIDADDYIAIGGWFNAGSTGTVTLSGGVDSLQEFEDSKATAEIVDDVTKQLSYDIEITSYTKTTGYFYAITGPVEAAQWDYYKFPVENGDSFSIYTKAGYSARAWVLVDSADGLLDYDSFTGATKQDTFVCTVNNSNAAYLIVNCQNDGALTITQHFINENVIDEDRIIINGKPLESYLEGGSNILYGKTLCCCGDSITYGADIDADGIVPSPLIESYQYSAYTKQWTRWTANEPAAYGYQIAERNNMIFYNGGVSGQTVQASGGDIEIPGFSDANGEYTLLPDDIDYLTLFYGWNDTAFGSLGTINDNTNASYYGAYNVVLPYLINKYPYTKIALIVPFGCDADHREAIRLLANKWGLACFDMYQGGTPLYYGKEDDVGVDASVVTANRAKFQANGAHPNFRGHYQIGTMLEEFLRGI